MPTARLILALAVLALAACSQEKRSGEPRMPADEPEAAEHPTGVSPQEGYRAQGTPSSAADLPAPAAATPVAFDCEGGHKVQISGTDALVTLKDGRTVKIARDPGSATRFRGEALAFRIDGNEGELSQDEAGTFHCAGG